VRHTIDWALIPGQVSFSLTIYFASGQSARCLQLHRQYLRGSGSPVHDTSGIIPPYSTGARKGFFATSRPLGFAQRTLSMAVTCIGPTCKTAPRFLGQLSGRRVDAQVHL
jgi:hypothetical protein